MKGAACTRRYQAMGIRMRGLGRLLGIPHRRRVVCCEPPVAMGIMA